MRFRVDGADRRGERPAQAEEDREARHRHRHRPPEDARPDVRQRLAESFEAALRIADGRAIALRWTRGAEHLFSAKFACPICSYSLPELEPRLFSFNSPVGACPSCDGLGQVESLRPDARGRLPDAEPRRRRGQGLGPPQRLQLLDARERGGALRLRRRRALRVAARAARARCCCNGSGEEEIEFTYASEGAGKPASKRGQAAHPFEGILPNFERRFRETDSAAVREDLARYQAARACPACHGTRLRREARHVFLRGRPATDAQRKPIYEIEHSTLSDCLGLLRAAAPEGARPTSPTRSCARSAAASAS